MCWFFFLRKLSYEMNSNQRYAKQSKHFCHYYEHPTTRRDGVTYDCRTLVGVSLLTAAWSFIVILCMKGKLLPACKLCCTCLALKSFRWHRLSWISGLDLPEHSGKQTALNVSCNRLRGNDSRLQESQNMRCRIGTSSGKRRNYYQELKKPSRNQLCESVWEVHMRLWWMSLRSFFREDLRTAELLQSSLPMPILDERAARYPCPRPHSHWLKTKISCFREYKMTLSSIVPILTSFSCLLQRAARREQHLAHRFSLTNMAGILPASWATSFNALWVPARLRFQTQACTEL